MQLRHIAHASGCHNCRTSAESDFELDFDRHKSLRLTMFHPLLLPRDFMQNHARCSPEVQRQSRDPFVVAACCVPLCDCSQCSSDRIAVVALRARIKLGAALSHLLPNLSGHSMAPSASYGVRNSLQEPSAAGSARLVQTSAKSVDTPSATSQQPRGTVDTTESAPASNGVHHEPIDTERFLSEQV